MGKFINLVLAPLCLQVCILCALCVTVSLPPVWHGFYRVTMAEKLALYEDGSLYAQDSSLISNGLWSGEDYGLIAEKLKGYRIGYKEQRHFEDVRKLLRKMLFLATGLALVLWIARKRISWFTVWKQVLILFVVEAAVFGVWVGISWRHMFRTLHWWVFQNDSWILPNKCYTLFLYPHAVWQALGVVLFAVMLVIVLCGIALTLISKTHRKKHLEKMAGY